MILLAPHLVERVLGLPPLLDQSSHYFRLTGLLVSGLGMLYIVSGRTNAMGFVFASLLDRPLVPPIMFILWYLGFIPGILAILFAIQDLSSCIWTYLAWRTDNSLKSLTEVTIDNS